MFIHYKEPFDHWIIDDFQSRELALNLSQDFIEYQSQDWYCYNNPLEVKKSLNNWWDFPPTTYKFIEYLNSDIFVSSLEEVTSIEGLNPDPGLHGAGWHIHGDGGKLNVHLDYSIHPKLMLERKLNLIYYLSEDWDSEWGGNLGLWSGNDRRAKAHVKTVEYKFNRAILFDTSQNSWHGFPDKIQCPEGNYRKSIAMYYLTIPQQTARPDRKRALYTPAKEQENDIEVLELIKKRVKLDA